MRFHLIYSPIHGQYLGGLTPPAYRPRWVLIEEGAAGAVVLYASNKEAETALAELRRAFPNDPAVKSAIIQVAEV